MKPTLPGTPRSAADPDDRSQGVRAHQVVVAGQRTHARGEPDRRAVGQPLRGAVRQSSVDDAGVVDGPGERGPTEALLEGRAVAGGQHLAGAVGVPANRVRAAAGEVDFSGDLAGGVNGEAGDPQVRPAVAGRQVQRSNRGVGLTENTLVTEAVLPAASVARATML